MKFLFALILLANLMFPFSYLNAAMASSSTADAALKTPASAVGLLLTNQYHLVPDDFKHPSDGRDDSPSINRAAESCVSRSIRCEIDLLPRIYYLNSPVLLSDKQVVLHGMGVQERTDQVSGGRAVTPWGGTWLQVDRNSFTPITIGGYGGGNSVVEDLGIYEVQPNPTQGGRWHPIDYPHFFYSHNGLLGITFRNIFMLGVTRGIDVDGVQRLNIESITGQTFLYMVKSERSYDVTRIKGVHQWPFWSKDQSVLEFQQKNSDVLILGRDDGAFISDIFTFGTRSAYHLIYDSAESSTEPGGSATKIWASSTYCDFTYACIYIDRNVTNFNMSVGYMSTQGQRFGAKEAISGSSSFIVYGSGSLNIHELYSQYADEAVGQLLNGDRGSDVQIDSMRVGVDKMQQDGFLFGGIKPASGIDTIYLGSRPQAVGGLKSTVKIYQNSSALNVVWPKVETVASNSTL